MKPYFSWNDLRHRWNKEDFELLEMMRHGLQPISKYGNPIGLSSLMNEMPDAEQPATMGTNWIEMPYPIWDQIAAHLIGRLSSAIFRRDNVLSVETATDLWKLTRPTLVWLDGQNLMEQWSINEFALCKMIVEYGLMAYDAQTLRSVRTGSNTRNDLGKLLTGTNEQKAQAMDRLRFKPFEIDEFKAENEGLFKTGSIDHPSTINNSQKKALAAAIDDENECFFAYKDNFWILKFYDERAVLKDKKGLQHIAFLIQYTGSKIPCRTIHLGKITGGADLSIIYEDHLEKEEKDSLISVAEKSFSTYKYYKDKPDSPEKEKSVKEWGQVKKYLFDFGLKVRGSSTGVKYENFGKASILDEKARAAVTNNIRNALEEIESKMPKLSMHLNERLKTGYKCSYKQDPNNKVPWRINYKN